MADRSVSFQSIILKLQAFWAEQGCVIWQPHHTEVGAGTMNPATALRVLGPEPWRVAYVEPSIRPADGRYGENPNRWQHYYQFQVILKPDPGDPQELYLRSLEALGIDLRRHDIRFVEDNWESPVLGAWGLGWEVWLDGQEITQFTYFQQSGGQTLDPVSVEITYGLERIALALQGVETFVDLRWLDDHLTYGDLFLTSEREFCTYNFELADVERLRELFDLYEAEAEAALAAGLVHPAHDYVLKCSHVFNILDARGAVGVAERAALFGRMRDLSRRVAEAYLASREAEGFPLLVSGALRPASAPIAEAGPPPSAPAPFLLEVGTEELPPADLEAALAQLRQGMAALLRERRLTHGEVRVLGTPRRLVVYVEDLAPAQAEEVTWVKGPPADRAFDEQGRPTQAALGFARSRGVSVKALQVRDLNGGRYVVAEVRQPGRPTAEVLQEALPALLGSLRFERSMRWNDSGVAFSRPIRWLLALHGEHLIPFTFAGLAAGRSTRGLRFRDPETQRVQDAQAYFAFLEGQGVVLDPEQRRARIWGAAAILAKEVGGEVVEDPDLLTEVAHLVEVPTTFRGSFEARFLELPRPVLIAVMKKHQRYFPVEKDGELLPYFIGVRNGDGEGLDLVRAGNEQVLRARFADAAYFIRRDLEQPLEAYLPRLATLTFQERLGSMLDKVRRVERLTAWLADQLGLKGEAREHALRAAHLCKADLATQMVIEMTSLQGEMGRYYALQSGEPAPVAEAIFEHYLPRFASDRLPGGEPGVVLGLADRLDTLVGLFAAGLRPSGGGDPFGLRRAAIGLHQILIARRLHLDLLEALEQAAQGLPIPAEPESLEACQAFLTERLRRLLLEEGHRHNVVEAVLAEQAHHPAAAAEAAAVLQAWVTRPEWREILQAYARCARIVRDQPWVERVDPSRLVEPAEKALYQAWQKAAAQDRPPGSVEAFVQAFRPLVPVINAFFDGVLVMAEEPGLRANRLGLLQRVVALARGVADLSRLEGF